MTGDVIRRRVGFWVAGVLVAQTVGFLPAVAATDWLDPSFAAGTPLTFDLGPGHDTAHDLVVQPDGKILVVGTADETGEGPSDSDMAVLRLLPDGRLDPTFGVGGQVRIDDGGREKAQAVALQPDGRILVAGAVEAWNQDQVLPHMALSRLEADGRRDLTFAGGMVVLHGPSRWGEARDIALQPDGRILVAGTGALKEDPTRRSGDFMVGRAMPDGTLDSSFGESGIVLTDVAGGWDVTDDANAVLLQPDGRIILAGRTFGSGSTVHSLVRYSVFGFVDPTFGDQGRAVGALAGPITDAGLTPDGSIVTAGRAALDGRTGMAVSRYRPDGALDQSFGVVGTTVVSAPPTSRPGLGTIWKGNSDARAMTIDRRGRVIAAGGAYGYGSVDLAVTRYNGAGGADSGFGRAGWVKTDVAGDYDVLNAVGLRPDGGVVAAGSFTPKGADPAIVVVVYPSRDGPSATEAWGFNSVGMLGNGTITDAHAPRPVLAPGTVQAVSAGAVHNVALDDAGRVYAWGWNGLGQLGNRTTSERRRPVVVPGLSGMSHVAAGYFHSMAVRGGLVYAWGWNSAGQLGDGATVNRLEPVQIPGLDRVVAVSGGVNHSLALRADGTVWAWGWNALGQLGDGTTVDRHRPVPVAGLTDVVAIAAGAYHSMAVTADGRVSGWGWNGFGQVGQVLDPQRHSPQPVFAGNPAVVAMAAGAYHSLALLDDGSVQAWGCNAMGQLGDATTVHRASPRTVTALPEATAIAGGLFHSLALGVDGRVRAWGWNGAGQLGDNSLVDRYQPVLTAGPGLGTAVSAGAYHSLALRRSP